MGLPERVVNSRLWKLLAGCPEYTQAVTDIRAIAEKLARHVETTLPDYTDHSVRHMDALWWVSDQIISATELESFTTAEAFILGATFYVHDLGMALAATPDGLAEVRKSKPYVVALERLQRKYGMADSRADVLAVRVATRDMHAEHCQVLTSEPLLGIDRHLIENTEVREGWAHVIAQVAASHHWDLDRVHRVLGVRNAVPTADGKVADLGLLACVLRLVDYAHINRERAGNLDRALRSEISADSVVHWDAQSNITGPIRDGNSLVYGCTNPIEDVDAWWLFYDLASGLDAEIRSVHEYLRGRAISAERFSLQGVRGVELPQTFIQSVQLAGDISPIDIRVQPHSMERVVELLGGPHLYGSDHLAPIRELIQNARDAIELRNAVQRSKGHSETPGQILLSLDQEERGAVLTVLDNGVGMARSVVLRHLIGVGSDFWHSAEFYRDFGSSLDFGFHPIGKFGIGFLSIFMLGETIEVETEAVSGPRLFLRLRGLGRRGEIREAAPTGEVGTLVRINLKPEVTGRLSHLAAVARARAPMLRVPIVIRTQRGSSSLSERIEPDWWKHVTDPELSQFVLEWRSMAYRGKHFDEDDPEERKRAQYYAYRYTRRGLRGGQVTVTGWPGVNPQLLDGATHVVSSGGEPRGVLRCSQGIAIDFMAVGDLTGIADMGVVPLTASREEVPDHAHGAEGGHSVAKEFPERLIRRLKDDVVAKLNGMERYGMIPARQEFLCDVAEIYGGEVLAMTNLRWIPVLEPPGNLIHQSRPELIERLRQHDRLIVASGVNPGSAYAIAAPHIPAEQLGRMLLIALGTTAVEVDYSEQQRLGYAGIASLQGPLDELIDKAPKFIFELTIISVLIQIVAEAWSTTVEDFQAQSWDLDLKKGILWANLSRQSK